MLQIWQAKKGLDATYGQLLRVFLEGGEARAAQELCKIVREIPGKSMALDLAS